MGRKRTKRAAARPWPPLWAMLPDTIEAIDRGERLEPIPQDVLEITLNRTEWKGRGFSKAAQATQDGECTACDNHATKPFR
jgi:hypothetical protein